MHECYVLRVRLSFSTCNFKCFFLSFVVYHSRMRFAITLQKNFQSSKKENLPPKPATPDTFFSKLGSHDRQKKKLDEERKKEYNQLLQQV